MGVYMQEGSAPRPIGGASEQALIQRMSELERGMEKNSAIMQGLQNGLEVQVSKTYDKNAKLTVNFNVVKAGNICFLYGSAGGAQMLTADIAFQEHLFSVPDFGMKIIKGSVGFATAFKTTYLNVKESGECTAGTDLKNGDCLLGGAFYALE